MASKDTLAAVVEFHRAFEFPEPSSPRVPVIVDTHCRDQMNVAIEKMNLLLEKLKMSLVLSEEKPIVLRRFVLILEELIELGEAMVQTNVVETLDALEDLEFVLMGTIVDLGFSSVHHEAFERVHASNMSKLKDGKPVKDAKNKVVKGDWYKPVDLRDLCEQRSDVSEEFENELDEIGDRATDAMKQISPFVTESQRLNELARSLKPSPKEGDVVDLRESLNYVTTYGKTYTTFSTNSIMNWDHGGGGSCGESTVVNYDGLAEFLNCEHKDVLVKKLAPNTFDRAWAIKESEGYQYGEDALEQVRMGWEMHEDCVNKDLGELERRAQAAKRSLNEELQEFAEELKQVRADSERKCRELDRMSEEKNRTPATLSSDSAGKRFFFNGMKISAIILILWFFYFVMFVL